MCSEIISNNHNHSILYIHMDMKIFPFVKNMKNDRKNVFGVEKHRHAIIVSRGRLRAVVCSRIINIVI